MSTSDDSRIEVKVLFRRVKGQWTAKTKLLNSGDIVRVDEFLLVEAPLTAKNGRQAWVHENQRLDLASPQMVIDLKQKVNEAWYAEVARWVMQ